MFLTSPPSTLLVLVSPCSETSLAMWVCLVETAHEYSYGNPPIGQSQQPESSWHMPTANEHAAGALQWWLGQQRGRSVPPGGDRGLNLLFQCRAHHVMQKPSPPLSRQLCKNACSHQESTTTTQLKHAKHCHGNKLFIWLSLTSDY